MKHKSKLLIGLSIILLGLALNKWAIEKFVPVGNIESLSFNIQILFVQLLFIVCGIYLITNKMILKIIILALLVPSLALSIINVIRINRNYDIGLTLVREHKKDKNQKNQEQVMLERVIFLDKNKIADLSQETGEILYSLHQSASSLTFKIPEDGILDTAIGVDPLIMNLFTGNVYFKLSVALNDGRTRTIFTKDINLYLSSEKEFTWQKVSIDLSEYSGQEITINFSKGYVSDSPNGPKVVYDLLPIDFMYWRVPNVRPKKLEDKYNVILISLDTLRADHLHFMGYPRKTSPNLDKLAQNGVFFTTVVSQAPWTTPSHFSIFTSTYPSVHQGNQPIQILNRHWNDTLPTMASILRDKGYVTAAFTGSGPISAKFGFYKGFDSYNETTSYLREDRCDTGDIEKVFHKSMQWLNGNKDRTFFLFFHTYEAHRPYCDQFFVNEEKINRSDRIKYRTALYDGDIRQSDFFVGKVIEKLNELRLTDNTIVVVTSDHGEDLGARNPEVAPLDHGHSLYDELLLVPLIFYNPIIFPQGERVDYQVRSMDILPTILEYLGYKEETSFQGKSLKGMIEGYDRISRPAYSEATCYGPERESVRANGYKYIYRISYGQLSDSTSRRMSLTPLHELYDLRVDPGERVNLAEERKNIVEKKQKLILSIFPERTLEDYKDGVPIRSIDISKNKELIKNLKSLGYIQ